MPAKKGLDWFPFDVDLLDCEELDFLRNEYGYVVNDIYIGLLTLLYRKEGYYIPYATDKDKQACVWYLVKHLRGGKYPVKQEAIPTVIEQLVACGLFSDDHFCKIITSERAQRTYYSATVDRKLESFDIRPEYWMLSDEVMRKLSKKHPYYLFLHPESKSDELKSKSDELKSKSDELPIDKSRVYLDNTISVSQSYNDIEDGRTDGRKEFYLDSAKEHLKRLGIKHTEYPANRFLSILEAVCELDTIKINGVDKPGNEVAQAILGLTADREILTRAIMKSDGNGAEIKNKLGYAISTLYNASKEF